MTDYLKYLIIPLLSQPDAMQVDITANTVNITVAKEDMGRVIGKHGLIISSIRNLTKVFASLHSLPPTTVNLIEV
jgi:predicted RNA-binding protein YlqC (UPF0109 family)